MKANKYWDSFRRGILNQAEHKSRTVKRWALEATADRIVLGLSTKANLGLMILLIDLRSWTNPYPCLFVFFDGQMGNIAWTRSGDQNVLPNKPWIIGQSPSSPFAFE